MSVVKKFFPLALILFLSFWAIKPFFVQGFFPMHDDTQVARVFEMGKMLRLGVFPVRFVPDLGYGYGYPIFNFYAPFAYYFGGLLTLIGFDALLATKIMMALGIIFAGIFMYFLAREFWGEAGGIVSSIFYIYVPYHAVDIYVRGDVAEFWAYAFIPLVFYGIVKIYQTTKFRYVLIVSVGYAALILSHNLTAMMVTPFILIAVLLCCCVACKKRNKFTIYYLLFSIFLALLLSAFYWLPAILEIKNTNVFSQIGGSADFRNHFVCLKQLWNSPWGFGGSVSGCTDGLSFKIGKLHILASIAAFILMLCSKRIRNRGGVIVFLSFLGLFLSALFTLEVSRPIWEAISAMAFFQYPWRFLLLVSFFSSLLAGSLVSLAKQFSIKPYLVVVPLIFFLLFFNVKLFVPQTILHKTAADYTDKHSLKWTASKISDEYLPPNFKKPKSEKDIAKHPLLFKETPIEKIANMISFIGFIAIVIGIILQRRILHAS